MILTEYDENEFRDFLKEEAWNEGHRTGMEEGLIEGTIQTCMDFQIPKEEIIKQAVYLLYVS